MDPAQLHRPARRRLTDRLDQRIPVARTHVVAAILRDVETLDPDNLPAVPQVVDYLHTAAVSAPAAFADAVEERQEFAAAVSRWSTDPNLHIARLPYRRVLSGAESSAWRAALRERGEPRAAAGIRCSTGRSRRRALTALGRRRVVELRENGTGSLLDVELFDPRYTGDEGLWCDDGLGWIAYADHEGALALRGVLARCSGTVGECD